MPLPPEAREVVARLIHRAAGASYCIVGVRGVLEVHEVALHVADELPAAPELEGGVELVEALERGLEAELLIGPGAIGTEEHREVLEQGAAGAVDGEAIVKVPVDHVAPEPVHEPRLIIEVGPEPLQHVVEAPRAAGAVPLRVPDGRGAAPARSLVYDPPSWAWA